MIDLTPAGDSFVFVGMVTELDPLSALGIVCFLSVFWPVSINKSNRQLADKKDASMATQRVQPLPKKEIIPTLLELADDSENQRKWRSAEWSWCLKIKAATGKSCKESKLVSTIPLV